MIVFRGYVQKYRLNDKSKAYMLACLISPGIRVEEMQQQQHLTTMYVSITTYQHNNNIFIQIIKINADN